VAKHLVICCDGTWNTADQIHDGKPCATNVVKLAIRTTKRTDNGTLQIVFYDQGVGTGNDLDKWTGGAFGKGLVDNIYDAYRFLIANYEPGDHIYLFGFSRGAYTARSIAGMIRKTGILRRDRATLYVNALELYRNQEHPDDQEPANFRAANALEDRTPIQCIGVWDTVGALGIPLRGLRGLTQEKHQFHDTNLSSVVRHAYHALAVDEHRAPFEPTLWTDAPDPGQTVEQVWFPGAHSDVGGGYPDHQLADIGLAWMMNRAAKAGLAFDQAVIQQYALAPKATGALHDTKNGLYRLTRGINREMKASPTEYVHRSVIDRYTQDATYRPPTLRALDIHALQQHFRATNDDIAAIK
jgi:uncharacterized protein (DUF2235 family)